MLANLQKHKIIKCNLKRRKIRTDIFGPGML